MTVDRTASNAANSQGSTNVRLNIRGREYRFRLDADRGWHEVSEAEEPRVNLVRVLEIAYDAEADPEPILRAHRAAVQQHIERGTDMAGEFYGEYAEATDLMDYHDIAEMCGFTPKTAINYNANRPGPPYMPPPVLNKGGSPLWARSSIQRWHSSRKGYDWRKGITNEQLAAQGRPLPGHRRRPRPAGESA